ncbi:putative flagellar motor protein MotB [Bartonella clarridgeiae 73]|uniref:Putative flagellar motor protein MotB n=1 Tax=Bartonella clarridgeiae (strain CCUG 45776 / CIP 104772 / 73) TaxID=696125 RepID=E6YH22_BARC7|nr:flagellar motor protein MotB [Bartonella clarridgeiae]WCR55258.1 MAG: Flagellar motor rotation protein MotB [Bartonella clarridgeiae]CBI76160.1 putative flagellar motor protein MotB [Bartonella clarridgeiae 73]
MKSDDQQSSSEIIIVRRGGHGDHDDHHGGVWKIAYADFMTAMMALFLVLWLVNVQDDATKEAIANYFNPIKLVDPQTSNRGIQHNDIEQDKKSSLDQECKDDAQSEKSNAMEEAELMRDPYLGLKKIVQSERNAQNPAEQQFEQGNLVGQGAGDSQKNLQLGTEYHDPFSPYYWSENVASSQKRKIQKQKMMAKESEQENNSSENSHALLKELTDLIEGETNNILAHVKPIKEGVMIELMDQPKYEMFKVGLSIPTAQTIDLISSMAGIIAKHQGDVVISGHTDARPYRSNVYDNWQLSTARAQMAYYMLVRGGLDEKRILRVEGYADRDLKNKKDPYAAENRRISIFIRDPKSEQTHEKSTLEKSSFGKSVQEKSILEKEKTP